MTEIFKRNLTDCESMFNVAAYGFKIKKSMLQEKPLFIPLSNKFTFFCLILIVFSVAHYNKSAVYK